MHVGREVEREAERERERERKESVLPSDACTASVVVLKPSSVEKCGGGNVHGW
jgi:hypothetical protein